eukprot:2194158-Ditylum_brightwellii.AAC.1
MNSRSVIISRAVPGSHIFHVCDLPSSSCHGMNPKPCIPSHCVQVLGNVSNLGREGRQRYGVRDVWYTLGKYQPDWSPGL